MGNSFQNTHINECMSEQKCCLIGPLSKERQVYPGSDLYNYSPQSYGLLVRGGLELLNLVLHRLLTMYTVWEVRTE